MSAHAEAAHAPEGAAERVTRKSDGFLEGAIASAVGFLGSYYLLDTAAKYLPIALAAPTPINVAIAAGAGLAGAYLALSGAGKGGSGEASLNFGTSVMRVIAPVVAPAWAGIARTANIFTTALGMRHNFR